MALEHLNDVEPGPYPQVRHLRIRVSSDLRDLTSFPYMPRLCVVELWLSIKIDPLRYTREESDRDASSCHRNLGLVASKLASLPSTTQILITGDLHPSLDIFDSEPFLTDSGEIHQTVTLAQLMTISESLTRRAGMAD